jgi:hypothetical protein
MPAPQRRIYDRLIPALMYVRKRPMRTATGETWSSSADLKRRARKPVLKINAEAKEVLEKLVMESEGPYVFSQPNHPAKNLEPWVLESQMGRLRDKIKTDPDAGLRSLGHTFFTEAGEYTDAFYACSYRRLDGRLNRFIQVIEEK